MNKLTLGHKASSSRVSQWVAPSFIDLSDDDIVPVYGKKRGGKTHHTSRCEVKMPRKRKAESLSSHLLKESVLRDQDQPWVDRYSPRSQGDLAVHKKKIEEVENWLQAHSNSAKVYVSVLPTAPQGRILLLTGPSGCGKTATVRVLSLELKLRIQEWTNPSNLEPFSSQMDQWTHGFSSISQLTQFQEFLLRANKYNCLRMTCDEGGGATDRKLILVEDFPNQFYRQPSTLHDILRRFVKTSRCPLVFIVSDSLSGDSSSRLLFPKDIQEELSISNISFNPVAPTTMKKVLTCISTQEAAKSCGKLSALDQAALEMLCSGSSGDIRSAINSLQFSCSSDTSLEKDLWRTTKDRAVPSVSRTVVSRTNRRKPKSGHSKEQSGEQAIGGKDAALFLFRALGKILHCKRGSSEGVAAGEGPSGADLPSHLLCHHREPLQMDPELVVERSHMSGEFFNLYLHQNYLDFFSELEDVDRASGYLSDADLLTADWTSRSTLADYGSSVATRGLLHSNSQQVSVGFRPLHKPHWLLVSKKYRENCSAAQSMFRSFCLTPVTLQTELLPYLAKLTNPMRNQAQITFIQDVGQMPLRKRPGRLKLETLADKEPALLETDTDDEEEEDKEREKHLDGTEEEMPASQPQPNTNQVLLENADLLIEEYMSD
ncbi:cell cycle checkpoint protein RAD17 isoform X2 [Gouania willdenowi]|uniref:cell cycle checkpoint protein RAD17 isoform X2 n=1 Tax=Gouania willdenowi TaxID=441366 RepID=UPI001054B410|nr:cell cycle checkpoint protein RAD17 isoform X2 [Gouania willdenowi]